jgi:acyl-CoA thioesterase FadM
MSESAPFATDKLIRFHHCDPAGIVFYPQYFVLFNELVEDWFNHGLGIDFARFHAVASGFRWRTSNATSSRLPRSATC